MSKALKHLIGTTILMMGLGIIIGAYWLTPAESTAITFLIMYALFATVLTFTAFLMLSRKGLKETNLKVKGDGYIEGIKDSTMAVAELWGESSVPKFVDKTKELVMKEAYSEEVGNSNINFS